jgi:hypothetical protein
MELDDEDSDQRDDSDPTPALDKKFYMACMKVCVCVTRYNFAAGRNQRIGKMDTSSKQQRTYEESESGIGC